MRSFSIGKYKSILLSIALFLILDASVLMLNFYISFEIADDATSINLAGRQRMLSQRMSKSLLDLDYSMSDSSKREDAINELVLSRTLFDETLTAFSVGGEATGAEGNKVSLNKADDDASLSALKLAQPIWHDYRKKIDEVISTSANTPNILQSAIIFGQANNLELLKLMNGLTVSLERKAASKAQRLRVIQTIGIAMALVNFFIILFHFIGKLRVSDEIVESARKETSEILLTVNEGLFLIHEDFSLGSQRSEKLYEILNIGEDEDINFEKLLKNIVSDKDLEAAQGFLRLLFNPKIKEKLIKDLNPLDKIQVNIDDSGGVYKTKYLSFDFKRVTSNAEILDVLATVNDITEKVLLEKELSASKESNEKQIEMLTSILHANPSLLKSFLNNAYASFSTINNILKRPAKNQRHFKEKTEELFIEIHNFKGESASLGLNEFVKMAHDFEEDLTYIRSAIDVKGQDFLSLTVRLDKIINYAQSINLLVDKLAAFNHIDNEDNPSSLPNNRSWRHLNTLVDTLSKKYSKDIILVASGLSEVNMPDFMSETINSICIQLIRNAVVHGIETPETRKATQKPLQGRIDVRLSTNPNGTMELIFEDDGAGFDFVKLKQKAIGTGKWTEDEVDHWDKKRLLSMIFMSGLSTIDNTTDDAGRGVGMDVVMQKVKQSKGKITISYKESQYSRFTMSFPMILASQAA